MYCERSGCRAPVKPNIVFFGESLPPEFIQILMTIGGDCDLLIVVGTALAVGPFNSVVDAVGDVPKVLINMENTAAQGYDFDDSKTYPNRLFIEGKCDEVVQKLLGDCEWTQDYEEMIKELRPKVNVGEPAKPNKDIQ